MVTYKSKENAYFIGNISGNAFLISSKHYSLSSAKEKAKNELKWIKAGKGKMYICKVVGEMVS